MRVTLLVLAEIVAVGARPLPAQVNGRYAVASLAGCYKLRVGPWSAAPFFAPPTEFELDAGRAGNTMRTYDRSIKPASLSGRDRGGWQVLGDSLLSITWSTGFADLSLDLRVVGDSLHGRASSANDVLPQPDRSAQAISWRVPCAPRPRSEP